MCPRFPLLHSEARWWACKRCPRRRQTQPWLCFVPSEHWDTTLTGCKASGPQTSSLSVTEAGRKGMPVSKQRMAHWIVDAITLAYQAQGVPCRSGWELTLREVWRPPGCWLVAPLWQIFVGLRAGQPLTHSLDSIAFVWKRFPPVFSPQTGRNTEGLRFQDGLLKTAPESPTVDPVELFHPLGSWT